jgi:hypothetical protein
MKETIAIYCLVIFSVVQSKERLLPITLVNNSPEINLYNPFAFIYSQSFYIGDNPIDEKVGPFACNIRKYLKPVPEAWSTVQTYRALRITAWSSLLGGIALMGTGIYLSINDNRKDAPHPLFFFGFGLLFTSSIPNEISKFFISSAVEKYNKAIK